MRTQIVQEAQRPRRRSARSRRSSIIVGAVIGLIGGLIAAIVVDRRAAALVRLSVAGALVAVVLGARHSWPTSRTSART